jgi:hypothetical protein
MIWLSWRQFRVQALVAGAALLALAGYLAYLARAIRDSVEADLVDCGSIEACAQAERLFKDHYEAPVVLIGALLVGVPAVIGAFWGAPLVAREIDNRTHQLAWGQSITRVRWLATKLAVVGAAAVVVTGVLSTLLSWAVGPYDERVGSRFVPMSFDARDVAPIGYAVFAFALGVFIGLLVRRTLPALALTLVVFAAVQLVMGLGVRSHLIPPETTSIPVNATTLSRVDFFGTTDTLLEVGTYSMPGAWVLSSGPATVLDADGNTLPFDRADVKKCAEEAGRGGPEASGACLEALDLHFDITYQPASRYWPLQWLEAGLFALAGLALAGLALWQVRRV